MALRGGTDAAFPVRCSGSRPLYMERALRCAWFQPSGVLQKPGTKSCACFSCLPRQSGSGSQELARRTLLGCSVPSALRVPKPQSPPFASPRPSRRMSTIQNLRRSLVRDWRPVCSAVGAAVLGAEPSPFPSLLPPAGLGRSVACELFSGLAQSLCSANGRQCVWLVNFLSLLLSHCLSW